LHSAGAFPVDTLSALCLYFPNPDKPEPKLKDKTEKGLKKISSGTQELTKVKNKILLIS